MTGVGHSLGNQLVVGVPPVVEEVQLGEGHRNERVRLVLENLVGHRRLVGLYLVVLGHKLVLACTDFCPCQLGDLGIENLARSVHLQVVLRQPLVQRRAFQRAVVDVDGHGRAVVEERRLPLASTRPHGHEGVLLGRAAEGKLVVGNGHAVNGPFAQPVNQVDLLAVLRRRAADAVFHLLRHRRQCHGHEDHR